MNVKQMFQELKAKLGLQDTQEQESKNDETSKLGSEFDPWLTYSLDYQETIAHGHRTPTLRQYKKQTGPGK